ncbi:MAG: 1,4-alpha-glucan branching enzyme, partial [Proteobacteria bacterium]|nr:1,4-alpha-glucan branching enzyme [Pseudomonadota bacterium]
MTPFATAAEMKSLLEARCADPHSILGCHRHSDGWVVRVFRPWASRVEIIIDQEATDLPRVHDTGLFEIVLPEADRKPDYRLRFTWPDGETTTRADAYTFWPQISEHDQHLWNEGRLDQAYHTLGARVWTADGVAGVRFAVWAPNAAGVSVVGDFNGWDGRADQMRILGSSGIWELFVPGLPVGELYKYEIRPRQGPPFLKADPFAQKRQMRPNTASVVADPSAYVWGDGEWMTLRSERNGLASPISVYEVHAGSWRRQGE